jgi:hypothetical protein
VLNRRPLQLVGTIRESFGAAGPGGSAAFASEPGKVATGGARAADALGQGIAYTVAGQRSEFGAPSVALTPEGGFVFATARDSRGDRAQWLPVGLPRSRPWPARRPRYQAPVTPDSLPAPVGRSGADSYRMRARLKTATPCRYGT